MARTRPSTRQSEANTSSSPSTENKNGTKRKASAATSPESVKSKGERPSKNQKTLEESIPNAVDSPPGADEKDEDNNDEMEGDRDATPVDSAANGSEVAKDNADEKSAFDEVKADDDDAGKTGKVEEHSKETSNGSTNATAVQEDEQREKAQPSNILEKGVIYFFTRGRVGVDDPSSVTDLQRSFFVLRPLPAGAKLTDGAVQDVGNNRLIALPKKVWPKNGRDKFMVFVEKGKTTMEDLKETFFQGSDYTTKTVGTRHTPEVSLIGEGVYAMTSTGQGRTTTHLAYMLTVPQELGEVQKDVGLADKGSFVLSVKNPNASSPSYAQLPATPKYPQEMLDEFGSLNWLPAQPRHLDYANASMLLIGEDFDSSGALEPTAQDLKSDEKEVPKEELEKLEAEDEQRIEHLRGDDTVFDDLGISSKEYGLKSTW